MAIQTEKVRSQLQLTFDAGMDENGDIVTRTKSFNNVKTAATHDQLYQVASALEPLQQRALVMVERNDDTAILEVV